VQFVLNRVQFVLNRVQFVLNRVQFVLNRVQFVFHEVLPCAWQDYLNQQHLFHYTSLTD